MNRFIFISFLLAYSLMALADTPGYVRWKNAQGTADLFEIEAEPKAAEIQTPSLTFTMTALDGQVAFDSFSLGLNPVVYLHFYDKASGDERFCSTDFEVRGLDVVTDDGVVVASFHPLCRTNLGGILSASFSFTTTGSFRIQPTSDGSKFQFLSSRISVN